MYRILTSGHFAMLIEALPQGVNSGDCYFLVAMHSWREREAKYGSPWRLATYV